MPYPRSGPYEPKHEVYGESSDEESNCQQFASFRKDKEVCLYQFEVEVSADHDYCYCDQGEEESDEQEQDWDEEHSHFSYEHSSDHYSSSEEHSHYQPASSYPQPSEPPSAMGTPQHIINQLPILVWRNQHTRINSEERCSICLCHYELHDRLRVIGCLHRFHQGCLDLWLEKCTTCPTCRFGVAQDE